MDFKGTKGKWEVEKAEIDSSGRGLYRVRSYNVPSYVELSANAQLISKAPEMLEELKIAVKSLKAVNSLGATKPIIERWERLIEEATTT